MDAQRIKTKHRHSESAKKDKLSDEEPLKIKDEASEPQQVPMMITEPIEVKIETEQKMTQVKPIPTKISEV